MGHHVPLRTKYEHVKKYQYFKTQKILKHTANLALEIYQKGLDFCVVHTTFLESQNELFEKKDRKIMKILNYVN